MMYEIEAKLEIFKGEEYCIPDDIIREDLVRRLADQLKEKIVIYTRYNTLTNKIEYSANIIFTNK